MTWIDMWIYAVSLARDMYLMMIMTYIVHYEIYM